MKSLRVALRPRAAVRQDEVAHPPAPYAGRRSGASRAFAGASGGGMDLTQQLSAMGGSGTLYAIVEALSTGVAAQEWALYREPKDGQQQADDEREVISPAKHAAAKLWSKPNPFFSTNLLVETVQQHIELAAEGYLLVAKVGKLPLELWPARPDRMAPVPDAKKFLAGWIYKGPDGEKIPFRTDEVLQIRKPNPLDPYRGLSAVAAIGTDLEAERYASEWNRNFFLNSAEPGGVIELPNHLSDPQWDEFVSRWQEQHRGVSRAHRVAVIEHGGKYVPRSMTQRDMQFAELRHLSRDVLMEAYRVNKTLLGITEDVNRAAALAAEYQTAKHLTLPRLRRWHEMLNGQLLPMFGGPGEGVCFDFESPVQADEADERAERESKANAASIYISAGFNPRSVQESLGLPAGMVYGTGEDADPDRDLMIQLVTAAPAALAPMLLPILLPGVEFPEPESEPAPGADPDEPEQAPGEDEQDPDGPADDTTGAREVDQPQARAIGASGSSHEHPHEHDHPHEVHAEPAWPAVHLAHVRDGVRAEEDLSDVQDAWRTALDRLASQWKSVTADQRAELREQIEQVIDEGESLAALAALTVSSAAGAELLGEALDGIATVAAAHVVSVAPPGVELAPTVPQDADEVASALSALLAARLAGQAGTEALRLFTPGTPGAELARAVDRYLNEQSDAGTRTQLGGALTGAQNRARVLTMSSGPVGSLYADETLDGNTCAPCRAINGRFVANTDDLGPYDRLYTSQGGYAGCLGGVRCRGTVTGVWRPQTATRDVVNDWSEPDHPRDPDGKFRRGSGPDSAGRRSFGAWSLDDVERIGRIQNGEDRDERLAAVMAEQGFDGPPTIVSREEFDALGDDHVRVYRGIANATRDGQAQQWAEDFRTGEFFPGVGMYGAGAYATNDLDEGAGYASGKGNRGQDTGLPPGELVRIALKPGSRIATLEQVRIEWGRFYDETDHDDEYGRAFGNPGIQAAALGYDAIEAAYYGKDDPIRHYVLVNRTALVVEAGEKPELPDNRARNAADLPTLAPPALSRRVAYGVHQLDQNECPPGLRFDVGPACARRQTFEELSAWVQTLVLKGEAKR